MRGTLAAFSPATAIENALTFAVSQCLAHGSPATLTGDGMRGCVEWHDGSGNHAIVVWGERGLVALGFDHEGSAEEPSEKFERPCPAELAALVVEASKVGRLATCAVWATTSASSLPALPVSANPGIDKTDAGVEALDALLGRVGPAQESVARRLGRRRLEGTFALTSSEVDEILDAKQLLSGPAKAALLDEPYLKRTATYLKKVGIGWKSPSSRIREINAIIEAARRSASSKRTAMEAQLLVGAATGDLEAVRAALDAGADLECRSVPGEFGHVFAATALQLSLYFYEDTIAGLLLERGADPVGNPGVFNILRIAVQRGHRRLCGALVKSGAPLTVDGCLANGGRIPGQSILDGASNLKDLAIVRLFVEGGSPAPRQDVLVRLIKLAEAAGDRELALRMRAWTFDPNSDVSAVRMALAERLAKDETPPPETCEYPRPRRPFPVGLSAADRTLFTAAASADLEGVKEALAAGASVGKALWRDELPPWQEGTTALIVALLNNHNEVAQHLIEAGADVDAWIALGRGEPATPLSFAVGRGNAGLVRLLLSRGAKDRTFALGALEGFRLSRPTKEIADAVEVVRMMLDAGASLPSDQACFAISKLAEAAGATDLIPRLERSWAPDGVTAAPTPIDAAANAGVVSALLERAGQMGTDPAARLACLTEAWRKSLHPRIADAAEAMAERVGAPIPCVAALTTLSDRCKESARPPFDQPYATAELGHVEEALRALMTARVAPSDPRAARLLMRWLWDGESRPVNGGAMARCEDAVAAILTDLRDVRFVESLEQRCVLRRPGRLQPARASLRNALAVMKAVEPGVLREGDLINLAAIEDDLAARHRAAKVPTIRDLYVAVFEAPDDDEPRRLLAQRLIEVDDSHGELIALQLARVEGAQDLGVAPNARREAELLRERGRKFLGAIEPMLGSQTVFERGFVEQAATSHSLAVPGSGLGTQLEWSTLRRLSIRGHSARLLHGRRLSGLRELLDVPGGAFDTLLGHAWPNLERLEQDRPRSMRGLSNIRAEALRERTPSLRSLRVGLESNATDGVVRILELWPGLKSLAVPFSKPDFGELCALAIERGLEELTVLGCLPATPVSYARPAADVRFRPPSSLVEISFPGELVHEFVEAAAAWLSAMGSAHVKSVVFRTPWGGKAKVPKKGTPTFSKGRKSIDLAPLNAAAEALGIPCSVGEAEPPSFGDHPGRSE